MVYYLYRTSDSSPVVFEFDEDKSSANKAKHGVDFIEAQALWSDSRGTEIAARSGAEVRRIGVGRIDDKMWSAVIVYRSERVRLISVRRSRSEEVADYEG